MKNNPDDNGILRRWLSLIRFGHENTAFELRSNERENNSCEREREKMHPTSLRMLEFKINLGGRRRGLFFPAQMLERRNAACNKTNASHYQPEQHQLHVTFPHSHSVRRYCNRPKKFTRIRATFRPIPDLTILVR